jgi:hypothetical protein
VSEHDLTQVATQLGLEPDEAKARIATVREAYETQAREMVGLPPPKLSITHI